MNTAEYIKSVVDKAPPLTNAQRAIISAVMYGSNVPYTLPPARPEPTYVYRYYDSNDALLYVGITMNLSAREAGHRYKSVWYPFHVRKTTALFPSREEAAKAELTAIRSESPLYNIAGKQKA